MSSNKEKNSELFLGKYNLDKTQFITDEIDEFFRNRSHREFKDNDLYQTCGVCGLVTIYQNTQVGGYEIGNKLIVCSTGCGLTLLKFKDLYHCDNRHKNIELTGSKYDHSYAKCPNCKQFFNKKDYNLVKKGEFISHPSAHERFNK